jgi:hypothetical protein
MLLKLENYLKDLDEDISEIKYQFIFFCFEKFHKYMESSE